MTALDVDELIMVAEAKWSLGDDEGAAADLEQALAAVWGLPAEVARVSEVASKLADARPSEVLSRFAQRAAEGAEALDANPTGTAPAADTPEETGPTDWRKRLGLVQLVVFTVVVIVVLVVQYLGATR